MTVTTKLDINKKAFILIHGKAHEVLVIGIDISLIGTNCKTIYQIDKNPAGYNYRTRFDENEIFVSKDELIESL